MLLAAVVGLRPSQLPSFDPLNLNSAPPKFVRPAVGSAAAATSVALALAGGQAAAAAQPMTMSSFNGVSLDPASFQPVCPASDGVYRFGQSLVVTTVGAESYKEYAPLIAGGCATCRQPSHAPTRESQGAQPPAGEPSAHLAREPPFPSLPFPCAGSSASVLSCAWSRASSTRPSSLL